MKTQAEIDAEFNEWFSKSFAAHFKAAISPHIKDINEVLGMIYDSFDEVVGDANKALEQIRDKLQVQERKLSKATGQVRAMAREQDRLTEVVARQHEELLILRGALARDVKLLPLLRNRGRDDAA